MFLADGASALIETLNHNNNNNNNNNNNTVLDD